MDSLHGHLDPELLAALPSESGMLSATADLVPVDADPVTLRSLAHAFRLRAAALQGEWEGIEHSHALSPDVAPQAELLYLLAAQFAPAPEPTPEDVAVAEVLVEREATWLREYAARGYSVLPGQLRTRELLARRRAAILTGSRETPLSGL